MAIRHDHGATSAPTWSDKRRTEISVAIGKEYIMKGARNDE
jgi:hypothetical protein